MSLLPAGAANPKKYFVSLLLAVGRLCLFSFACFLLYRIFCAVFTLHNIIFASRYLFVSCIGMFSLWLLYAVLREYVDEERAGLPIVALGESRTQASLTLFQGSDAIKELKLSSGFCSIGRGSTCDIVVDDERASRRHCTVFMKHNKYYIQDDESQNGTYVGGEQVGAVPRLLQDGDEITLSTASAASGAKLLFKLAKLGL